ncbi:hypothetical protein FH5_04379 [Priestia endophytica]|nr:hypothetical protein FH5_04379 [Priestia endophytica]
MGESKSSYLPCLSPILENVSFIPIATAPFVDYNLEKRIRRDFYE